MKEVGPNDILLALDKFRYFVTVVGIVVFMMVVFLCYLVDNQSSQVRSLMLAQTHLKNARTEHTRLLKTLDTRNNELGKFVKQLEVKIERGQSNCEPAGP